MGSVERVSAPCRARGPSTPTTSFVRPGSFANRCAAVVVGSCLAAGLGEFAYRLLRQPWLSPTTNPSYVVFDPEVGWSYRPFAKERHRSDEFDVEVDIHSAGYRGPEWQEPSSRRRLLVLGDSQAFGWGVPWSETMSARLAVALPDWDVCNAAVAGYGTDQQLLTMRRLLPRLRPHVVVSVFCDNDLWESSCDEAYGRSKPQFLPVREDLALRSAHLRISWLEEHSALFGALQKKLWERRFAAQVRDLAAEWRMVERLYCAMRNDLSGRLLFVVSEESRLGMFAAREPGITHVDVRDALGRAAEPTRFAKDGHWNAAGHAVVAAAVEAALRDSAAMSAPENGSGPSQSGALPPEQKR